MRGTEIACFFTVMARSDGHRVQTRAPSRVARLRDAFSTMNVPAG